MLIVQDVHLSVYDTDSKKQNLYIKRGGGREKGQLFKIFKIFDFFIAQKVKKNDSGITIYQPNNKGHV